MPDFCVQVGTSLPRGKVKANRAARRSRGPGSSSEKAAGAGGPSPSPAAAEALKAAAYHGSSQATGDLSAPKSLQPIAGSREQRKKARAARFPRVVVADTVTDYRRVIPLLVDPADIVLEVGCCSGATTNVLFDHCACAVGALRQHCSAVAHLPSGAQPLRKRRPSTVVRVLTYAQVLTSATPS
eukprot:COSAG02_NODE_1185_length_14007_cov_52.908398_6_plen_184_part_00